MTTKTFDPGVRVPFLPSPTPGRVAPAPAPAPARAVSPADLYRSGLHGAAPDLTLRGADGTCGPVPIATWLGPLTAADHDVLARAAAPVLDVGCGPGRHLVALARRGVPAAGIDAAPAAVELARSRGVRVIHASVFAGSVPGAGTWGTALLLDGNIGIGGQPVRLLARLRTLLRPDGEVLVELEAPGCASGTCAVRLEGAGAVSEWFPWARVGVDGIYGHAHLAGLTVTEVWEGHGRWFARLAAAR
ncbi:hypothetical protein DSM112329_03741 [Paraconexibacter sp. AEG42_29]|uniref:Methyltransferase domain-containing protein n=1 Tax=Paraconexibacter sp. AEG42_29 TaxID=2997339 RepID=A0AAU7AYS5_9ACTN